MFLFVLITIKDVYTQPPLPTYPYTLSAHGNVSYGVKRSATGFPTDYARGNCAHCHEQHASIGGSEPAPNSPAGPDYYLLFKDLWVAPPQSNQFCFGCHIEVGSYQSSFSRTNYSYSYWAGGDTTLTYPDSIYESFQFVTNAGVSQSNCGSSVGMSHMLRNIRGFLSGKWGFSSDNNYVDPCSGCHNPHRAKRDPHTTIGRTDGSGNLIVSSVSFPSQHSTDNNAWQLWGDESGERMRDYALSAGATYCAPYYYNSTTTREPDGCSAVTNACQTGPTDCTDGSRVVDSATFCRDCHLSNWGSSDLHGGGYEVCCDWSDKAPPYTDGVNYVLSCLDCHEPHGSPNRSLLRQEVNGTQVPIIPAPAPGDYRDFCSACHSNLDKHNAEPFFLFYPCSGCHRHGDDFSSPRCGCSRPKVF